MDTASDGAVAWILEPDEHALRTDHPRERLTIAVRELNEAVGTTRLDADELERARAEVEALTRRLVRDAQRRMHRRPYGAPVAARRDGVGLGLSSYNPSALPVRIRFHGDDARGEVTVGALHEGPPDSVHGGVIGWLMDTMLGVLVQAQGTPAVTASLEIRYRARTPLHTPLALGATIRRRSGRRLEVDGWIDAAGRRTVEAVGRFMEVEPTAGERRGRGEDGRVSTG